MRCGPWFVFFFETYVLIKGLFGTSPTVAAEWMIYSCMTQMTIFIVILIALKQNVLRTIDYEFLACCSTYVTLPATQIMIFVTGLLCLIAVWSDVTTLNKLDLGCMVLLQSLPWPLLLTDVFLMEEKETQSLLV